MKTYKLYVIKREDRYVTGVDEDVSQLSDAWVLAGVPEDLLTVKGERVVSLHVTECEEGETPPDVEALRRDYERICDAVDMANYADGHSLCEVPDVDTLIEHLKELSRRAPPFEVSQLVETRDRLEEELSEARETIRRIHHESVEEVSLKVGFCGMANLADQYVRQHSDWYRGAGKKGEQ